MEIQVVNWCLLPDSPGGPGRSNSAESQPADPSWRRCDLLFCQLQLGTTAVLTLLPGTSHEGGDLGVGLQLHGIVGHKVRLGLFNKLVIVLTKLYFV